jgi:hypothetical protein
MNDTSSTRQARGNEVGLLRRIVEQLAERPAPNGPLTQEHLRAAGFARATLRSQGLAGILRPGYEHFTTLTELMFCRSPKIERGATFSAYQNEFFDLLLSSYLGRDPRAIVEADAVAVEDHLSSWFADRATTRTFFIPCAITPAPSPRFAIGSIKFIFVDDIAKSEYISIAGVSWAATFENLAAEMRKERAHWLAAVEVQDCDRDRGQEVGELAVDIGLVAFQLAQPYLGTRNMSRLAARRGLITKQTLSVAADGDPSGGLSVLDAGMSIGQGYLGQIVQDSGPLITSVGHRVRAFTTGSFRLPKLEQAWCDAAYWLHEGLAEPRDSIAVTKLETAIEVLLRAESKRGSERRIISAMDTFYALRPEDPITPNSSVTTKAFARRFVDDRSRVLHGTVSTLNVRMADSRDSLENLVTTLVRATVQELDLYLQSPSPADDTDAFLSWIKARRRNAKTPVTT